MTATTDLIDEVRRRFRLRSDYAFALHCSVSAQRVSNYRLKGYAMDDDLALTISDMLGLDALSVIATIRADAANNEKVSSFWSKLANRR